MATGPVESLALMSCCPPLLSVGLDLLCLNPCMCAVLCVLCVLSRLGALLVEVLLLPCPPHPQAYTLKLEVLPGPPSSSEAWFPSQRDHMISHGPPPASPSPLPSHGLLTLPCAPWCAGNQALVAQPALLPWLCGAAGGAGPTGGPADVAGRDRHHRKDRVRHSPLQ